jgi:hypothetical protein
MPSVNLPLFGSGGVPEKKSSRADSLWDKIEDDKLTCAEKGKHQQNSKQKKQPAKQRLEPVNFFH